MSTLTKLTLAQARDGLRARQFSAVELTTAYIAAMEERRDLNAYITETPEAALEHAAAADARLARNEGEDMTGIPIAHKDMLCTKGIRTTAGSRMLETFTPPYESTVSAKLAAAGAVTLGKANLDEFAMGAANLTSFFGPVVNPWKARGSKEDLVPGGSSGGSAAAVAADCALAATGTDTGGSIRQPASYCGVVGLKPTYGRCSRWGIIAFASSLDQAGPITRTVGDAAIMLRAMAGFDPQDATCADVATPNLEAALNSGIKGLTIGVPKEYHMLGEAPEIEALWAQGADALRAAGANVKEISLPHTKYAPPTYSIIASAEASSNLARYDGVRYGLRVDEGGDLDAMYMKTRRAGFGLETRSRIMVGVHVLCAGHYDDYYRKAQQVRACIARDFQQAFENVDAVLTPTTPDAAFPLKAERDDPVSMYLHDAFVSPASLAGLPALSVPAGLSDAGLPLGLQVIGRPFDEATVLRVGNVLEAAMEFPASAACG